MAANKTNSFENEVLLNWFNNSDIANVGDAAGIQNSAAAGSLYVALFTADPTETGAFTNEATYTSYARVAVARSGAGWTVSGATVSNAALVAFPQATGGTNTITHAAIVKTLAGTTASDMIIYGPLNASLSVSTGVTPQFAIGAISFEEK